MGSTPGTPTGGEVKDIGTSAKDMRISEMLPQLAEQMHLCTVIRSLTSKEGDHQRGSAFVKTGYRPGQIAEVSHARSDRGP